jgi:hypothetical protein
MTSPAASAGNRAEIRCVAPLRILAPRRPAKRPQLRASKGLEIRTGQVGHVGIGRADSPRLPSYADLRILWPNSS